MASPHGVMDVERIRADFDRLAQFSDDAVGTGRYQPFLQSAIPAAATDLLDVGCGTGILAVQAATPERRVIGIDLSPAMIERAHQRASGRPITFLCGDFIEHPFEPASFDCIISSAALHHMPSERALLRMAALLKPGGRLIVHDLRRNTRIVEELSAGVALLHASLIHFMRTGRPRQSRAARALWKRHGMGETYLSIGEARALADQLLPGAVVHSHWLWRYTIIWEKPMPPMGAQ